jgi:guanylate kinase
MLGLSLKHHQEFKDILEKYQISDRAKKALEGLKLVLVVAPTSTGRNTIIRYLIDNLNYYFIISDTTRPAQMRDGKMEENGVQYFFRSEQEILADLKAGEFLEAAIIHNQQVSGISIRELEKAKNQNKIAITDIEIIGAGNIMRFYPKAKAVFLVPPNFTEWQKRIAGRGYVNDQELKHRLISASKELAAALQNDYYHFVVAENIKQSALVVDAIANDRPNPHQGRGRELISRLQFDLAQKLEAMGHGRGWQS